MTLLINCQNISKSLGPRTFFEKLSFTVNSGERLAVVGANGSGKTTLLRILAGLASPDSGRVTLSQNVLLGYLPQQEKLDEQAKAAEVLFDTLNPGHLDEAERYSRVHGLLSRAGFTDYSVPVHTLSGGWRKRLSICRALLLQPDLLIMDEPTNHLDLEGILWLEKMLANSFPGCPDALVMVSHDRYFLENLATRTMEIAPFYPKGYFPVDGNYSAFLQQKENVLSQQQAHESKLANRVQRETEWLRRGPKARTTKARYRVEEACNLREELSRLQSRNKAAKNIGIDFEATGRKTRKLLVATDLSKAFNNITLFSGLDILLTPGRRIGLLGRNGSGKSTLIQILADAERDGLRPDRGSIRIADGVKILFFAQNRKQLDHEQPLRAALSPEGDSVIYQGRSLHIVTWAQKFLFRTDQLDTPVGSLSGGEKARILIANIMRRPADILLLDEPTNDLDIPSLQVLEESILEFPGAVVLVTHDRFLLNRVCQQVLGFDGEGHVTAFADYEQYQRSLLQPDQKNRNTRSPSPSKKNRKVPGRLSYLDQREYDCMEETIEAAEEEEQQILQVMHDPANASNAELLERSWHNIGEIRQRIRKLYSRWEELERIKNSAD